MIQVTSSSFTLVRRSLRWDLIFFSRHKKPLIFNFHSKKIISIDNNRVVLFFPFHQSHVFFCCYCMPENYWIFQNLYLENLEILTSFMYATSLTHLLTHSNIQRAWYNCDDVLNWGVIELTFYVRLAIIEKVLNGEEKKNWQYVSRYRQNCVVIAPFFCCCY